MSYDKERVSAYYLLGLHDIAKGLEIDVLEAVLTDLEEEEDYEACDGLSQAINFAKKNTVIQILEEYDNALDRLAEEIEE